MSDQSPNRDDRHYRASDHRRERATAYAKSYRSSIHYWQFERALWLISIPVCIYTGWIKSITLVSSLSIYALYQNAVQRIDQIRQKANADRTTEEEIT